MVSAKQIPLPLALDVVVVPRPPLAVKIVPHTPPAPAKPPPIPIPQEERRTCKVCQKSKTLDPDHFHVSSRKGERVYYRRTCKDCVNQRAREQTLIAAEKMHWDEHLAYALKEAQRLAEEAWGNYQNAIVLFKQAVETDVQCRKQKFKDFLQAQKVVLLVQTAQR